MLFRSDLWEAVALGIDAENRKIEIFVKHNLSRGIAREAILRDIILQHTPFPYEVRTGFIYTDDANITPGKQCDILVYDPQVRRPYYQLDEFVVLSKDTARVIVEVKSTIDDDEFGKIRAVKAYGDNFGLPVLGFVYGGWLFSTFCEKVRALASDLNVMPQCLVVHERNYLAIRTYRNNAPICLLMDFSQAPAPCSGMATAYFMNIYEMLVRREQLRPDIVIEWFANRLTIVPAAGKMWVGPDGVLREVADLIPTPTPVASTAPAEQG